MNDAHQHSDVHGDNESWDDKALWYVQVADLLEPEQRHATEALLDAVGVGPGKRVLELACGPGHCTAAADARGAASLGVDRSSVMIDAAKRRFPASRFQIGDMLEPPAGPWDAIVCRFGAHHADPSWLTAARNVLRPGGRLAVAEFRPDDAADEERGMIEPEAWRARFEAAGFTDIRTASRSLQIDRLVAQNPQLERLARQGDDAGRMHLHDRVVWIISGSSNPKSLMVAQTDAAPSPRGKNVAAAFGRIFYRAGGALFIVLGAAAAGGAVGLVLAGPEAEGLDALGAAIWGMFIGAIVGVILGAAFLFAPLPRRILTRWIIVAVLAALFFGALGIQEIYD